MKKVIKSNNFFTSTAGITKRNILLIILIISLNGGYAQTISLTFNAKNSLTQDLMSLDSVNIQNLAQSYDTTLYDAVSVLNMKVITTTGLGETNLPGSESFIVKQNEPNPFNGYTLVRIFLKNAGKLNLAVFNSQANKLSEYSNKLENGWHLFAISTNETNVLFLKVSDNSFIKTIKLISIGAGNDGNHISYKGLSGQGSETLKSASNSGDFIFYLGNQLMFTAYIDGYHDNILFDSPLSDQTYTFTMLPNTENTIPTVFTPSVTNITTTTVIGGGTVTSDGGAIVDFRGICWGTLANPTIANNYISEGSGTTPFFSNIAGLNPFTVYYVRAFARNCLGLAYGNEVSFKTSALPFLDLSTLSLSFDEKGITTLSTIGITSNISWSVASNQVWCHVSATSGLNNGAMIVTCDGNPTGFPRSATLTFTGTGIPGQMVTVNQQENYVLPSVADGDHMLLGNPNGAIPSILAPDNYLMIKSQYDLSYNNTKHIPNWTSWYLGTNWLGNVSRQDDFRPDPALYSVWYAAVASEFSGSGFDRGHMCPSADRTDLVSSNSATFLMTNMIPQAPKNNQQTWANLENYCRSLVTSGNELYIISGGFGQGGVGSSGARNTVGNGVVVPAQTWKIMVVLPNGTGDLARITNTTRVIAVVMPNTQSCSDFPWTYYKTSVDSLEVLTGFDFLSNVSTTIQNEIEAKVDNQ